MLPMPILLALVVLLSAVFAVLLVRLVRYFQRSTPVMRVTGDVEGIYIAVIGGLYAIFITFMIFVVWTQFDEAKETVEREAGQLVDVYRLAEGLPQPYQDRVQTATVGYARAMIRYEWPAMTKRKFSPQSQVAVDHLWDEVIEIGTNDIADSVIRNRLVNEVNDTADTRSLRLLQSRTSLPTMLYVILFFGASLTITFAAVFTVVSFWVHALKASVIAVMLGVMLLAVWVIDHPFQGSVRVSSEPFQIALERIRENK